ncbi:immunity 52 family protein [Paraburkholderia sp. MMS20-SJTN17]|uniref:Immunity 52 family protein n=1 Tax=Paraburkholderia translucens TaxID=2886945 RepID=A0ABS8KLD8_9BURK|nr:immunity 52 family protein [Paraburkholderia sp. MMS20-SJTN17]MCC8405576.1 immunity 52 family protein [Paraburkholderia sp. MMS20-SJTN17]
MEILSLYRDANAARQRSVQLQLERIGMFVKFIADKDQKLGGNWYLKGDDLADSLRTAVFTGYIPTNEAVGGIEAENKDSIKLFAIWNGENSSQEGASFSLTSSADSMPDMLRIILGERDEKSSRLGDYRSSSDVVAKLAELYESSYASLGPAKYSREKVFDDRPGVSWMLYLPHTLTAAQVPEARALSPVMRDGKQQGTIIVSVTDEVFDVNNRAHVKAANDIEIRLADQDLLPRFIDL